MIKKIMILTIGYDAIILSETMEVNRMNKVYKVMFLCIGFVLLVGCKPSDKYVGDWYALSMLEEEVMVNFSKEKTMTIRSHRDEDEMHEINQTATGIQNNIRYFRIDVEGDNYYIVFEDSKEEDNAKFIKQTNEASDFEDVVGDVIFLMNREDFPSN